MPNRTVLLVGPPGSGKTTQGRRLAESMGAQHFSMGDEIRRRRAVGAKLAFDRKTGLLTPEATRALLEQQLSTGGPLVIDGIPRTADQVPLLVELGITSAIVVHVDVDFATAMTRMRGRGRDGEDPGVIAMRHGEHQRRSEGLLEACASAGWQVCRLDGAQPVEDVSNAVRQALNEVCEEGG